jgi:putative ABC transport system substrate-binding protein
MKRRDFVTLLGGTAVFLPFAASAQQRAKLPIVGFFGPANAKTEAKWAAAFAQRMRELGWIDGRTVAIEYRYADAHSERYSEIAAELVRLKVDVIVTAGSAGVAVKHATSAIPIVFAVAGDPVGSGLVASLARPGGNATGLSLQATDIAGKRLELLREVLPSLRRLAIMGNVGYPAVVLEMKEAQAAAHTLGLETEAAEIRRAEDIAPVFDRFKGRVDALYVSGDALVVANTQELGALALAAHLPTIFPFTEFVEAKGLMSYGANFPDLWRHAADIVDKILHGAKPADIPVEQPTKFELAINLKTAKTLGLEVPLHIQQLADEVIE